MESETSDFYGSVKLKEFDPVQWISGDSATRLTSRYIQRYSDTPREVTFDIEERKIQGITIGSVIEVVSIDKQSPSGATLTSNDRVQILKLQPNLNGVGRKYTATALAYTPLFTTDPNEEQFVTLTGSIRSINLATYVGAPTNIPLNYTFIFDGCEIGSAEESSTWLASVRAGAWHPDSRIRIICTNNTLWSAKGGDSIVGTMQSTDGANSYDSGGIETEIYLNYQVGSYQANSSLLSSGGSGGSAYITNGSIFEFIFGGGGSGIPSGLGYVSIIGSTTYKAASDGGEDFGGIGGRGLIGMSNPYQDSSGGSSLSGVLSYPAGWRPVTSTAPTLAGFSISGALAPTDITVYNLSSESAKFKPGSSVAGVDYTLIDS